MIKSNHNEELEFMPRVKGYLLQLITSVINDRATPQSVQECDDNLRRALAERKLGDHLLGHDDDSLNHLKHLHLWVQTNAPGFRLEMVVDENIRLDDESQSLGMRLDNTATISNALESENIARIHIGSTGLEECGSVTTYAVDAQIEQVSKKKPGGNYAVCGYKIRAAMLDEDEESNEGYADEELEEDQLNTINDKNIDDDLNDERYQHRRYWKCCKCEKLNCPTATNQCTTCQSPREEIDASEDDLNERTRQELLKGNDLWICTSCMVNVTSLLMQCERCHSKVSFVPLTMPEFEIFVRHQRRIKRRREEAIKWEWEKK